MIDAGKILSLAGLLVSGVGAVINVAKHDAEQEKLARKIAEMIKKEL